MSSKRPTVTLTIPSQIGYEKQAMAVVESLAKEMGFSHPTIESLKTAIAEACLNAIEHGNQFNAGLQVRLQFIPQNDRMEILVEDTGAGGTIQLPIQKPDIETKLFDESSKRGWGLFLIRNMVDEFEVTSLANGGNRTRMVRYLDKQKAASSSC